MSQVESIPFVRSPKIDRTPVRVANTCSSEMRHTKRWADCARAIWPVSTDAEWAHAAGVNIRLAQYWLEEIPKRVVNGAGMRAVLTALLTD